MPIVKFIASNSYLYPIEINEYDNEYYSLKFSYAAYMALQDEIKNLEGARWEPEKKIWIIKKSERNKFALKFLTNKNPHQKWLKPLEHFQSNRNTLMKHQEHILDVILNRRQVVIAGEMGIGKTLSAIEAIELSRCEDILWAAPNSALSAAKLELVKWKANFWPEFSTYDSLKKLVAQWPKGRKPPKFFLCDECHRLKNNQTQRYQAAKYIIENMLNEYDDPYIVLLSGTPVSRDPSEWWPITELIRPGWLRESNIQKFKRRLALIKDQESLVGGTFPKLITWWDSEEKCKICGKFKDDFIHTIDSDHNWVPSVNEVAKLYYRLNGIVDRTFKKDVLKELPDKIYRIIRCQPTEDTLRAAKLIVANSRNAVTANILLRELSDGFLYKDKEIGEKECDLCKGNKKILVPKSLHFEECPNCGNPIQDNRCIGCSTEFEVEEGREEIDCPNCNGEGVVPRFEREAVQVFTPKEQAVKDLLEEYEEVGRVVIYCGFQGSVDRCITTCRDMGWEAIRVDGRGWVSSIKSLISPTQMLQAFQDKDRSTAKLAFVGNPIAGGLGITLTESPVEIFYSNSFDFAARVQSEDRIHRPGIDLNKGATIIDLFHLPSDEKVLENLKNKKKLQDMTLKTLQECFAK